MLGRAEREDSAHDDGYETIYTFWSRDVYRKRIKVDGKSVDGGDNRMMTVSSDDDISNQ